MRFKTASLSVIVLAAMVACIGCQSMSKNLSPVEKALSGYKLVYDLDLAKLGPQINYDVDNSKSVGGFTRIAYHIELQKAGQEKQFVVVSMDAFTGDAGKIGIPVTSLNVTFQTHVKNMNILSNAQGIPNGEGLTGGNIEFWPNRYNGWNVKQIPGAVSEKTFDFGDGIGPKNPGYGCMQVHNYEKKTTLFAINNWSGGNRADIGIGNNPGPHVETGYCDANLDWTFAGNAASYQAKRLRMYVK